MASRVDLNQLLQSDFQQEGLYLFFSDAHYISITEVEISKFFAETKTHPSLIPKEVIHSHDLELCDHCPNKSKPNAFCGMLKPILPFLKDIDRYMSYDNVTAVYKQENPNLISISETTLQEALKYVSILSLVQYCKTNKRYWKYFYGITPLLELETVIAKTYLNLFWHCQGDQEQMKRVIAVFVRDIGDSSKFLLNRLRAICSNDAFINAIANTQVSTEILSMDVSHVLMKEFEDHNSVKPGAGV
ncbi:MAG: hypothetical protein QNJ97_24750 [Myxococcota bacterium]|nr:hypothetical protein [Myxococcota bacterium]